MPQLFGSVYLSAGGSILVSGVVDTDLFDVLSGQESVSAENGIFVPQVSQLLDELDQGLVFLGNIPVYPAYFSILTVSVVIPFLRPTKLVSGHQHGRPLGQKQRGQEIS